MDTWRAGAPGGARPLGLRGSLCEARRPARVPLPRRATDGRGRTDARIRRRCHRPDCYPGWLRDDDGIFQGVQTTLQLLSRPLPGTRRHRATQLTASVKAVNARASQPLLLQGKRATRLRYPATSNARSRHLSSTTTTGARSTRPGMAERGRVMRCNGFTAQLERTWKCRAVAICEADTPRRIGGWQ